MLWQAKGLYDGRVRERLRQGVRQMPEEEVTATELRIENIYLHARLESAIKSLRSVLEATHLAFEHPLSFDQCERSSCVESKRLLTLHVNGMAK